MAASPEPARSFFDIQLRAVTALDSQVDAAARIAERAAAGLERGGQIYLCGEKGIVAELLGRAGGLCGAKVLPLDKPLSLRADDMVLLSDYGVPGKLEATLAQLVPTQALVIVFAPAAQASRSLLRATNVCQLPVDVPPEGRLVTIPGQKPLIPTASPAVAAAAWTYVAELLAACRRHEHQLAIYLSINLDPGRQRFARTKSLLFEPDLHPRPVPAGQYGHAFLRQLRQSLLAIRDGQLAQLQRAAAWLREAQAAGRAIVRNMHGHLPPLEAGVAGDVDFFTATVRGLGAKGVDWIRGHLRPGDVYLLVGYQWNEDDMAAAAHQCGARTIFLTSTPPGPEQKNHPQHLAIDPHWPTSDGCLELEGYDVRACPLSAILNMSCYWAICAEAVSKP
jgi:uncharacterized phosphosugar-binding protein